ncbi:hypothetical protein PAMP_015576 [Pampus punctatissimus]
MNPVQRSVYKDLVLLLQKEKYLTGEMSFEHDNLVEGGCLNQMHNGTEYREVRQFQSAHHLVRFYFVTRIYSCYMRSILEDLRHGLKPDVVIVNSCVWDISRYNTSWINDYKENLHRFFEELSGILPEETLVIWNLTMPLGNRIKGAFLVPEIEHKASQLRYDVIEANFYSGTLADCYGMDVLDFHFHFRFSLQHRMMDGVHWNALAHRRITSLLSQHAAQAWGVSCPLPLTAVEHADVKDLQRVNGNATRHTGNTADDDEWHPTKGHYNGYGEEFCSDSLPVGYLSFEENNPQSPGYRHETARACRAQYKHGKVRNGSSQPARYYHDEPHQYVMRHRYTRHHYAPYTHHRHSQHTRYAHYY